MIMGVDKHTLQKWVAGGELRVRKSHRPFAALLLVNRVKKIAERTRNYTLSEKIDLTRARNFRVQESSEDTLSASIVLPVVGKRGMGNDVGMAIASFDYTDGEGDDHHVIAICAYEVTGVVRKERELKRVLMIPVV
jgi:hypothetical protein